MLNGRQHDYRANSPSEDRTVGFPKTEPELTQRIEAFGARYDPSSALTLADQHLACEALAESKPVEHHNDETKGKTNDDAFVKWNGNGACKPRVNFELTPRRLEVINELKTYDYLTSPVKIAQLLEDFFVDSRTRPGWWLTVAQLWTPRPILRVIDEMVKAQTMGFKNIQVPAAYFTKLIGFRKKRKQFQNFLARPGGSQ